MTDDICAIESIANALSHALVCLDVTVFDGDPTKLLHLANSLPRTLNVVLRRLDKLSSIIVLRFVLCIRYVELVHVIAPQMDASLSLKPHQDCLLERLRIFRDARTIHFVSTGSSLNRASIASRKKKAF